MVNAPPNNKTLSFSICQRWSVLHLPTRLKCFYWSKMVNTPPLHKTLALPLVRDGQCSTSQQDSSTFIGQRWSMLHLTTRLAFPLSRRSELCKNCNDVLILCRFITPFTFTDRQAPCQDHNIKQIFAVFKFLLFCTFYWNLPVTFCLPIFLAFTTWFKMPLDMQQQVSPL